MMTLVLCALLPADPMWQLGSTRLRHPHPIEDVAFSGDGKSLLGSGGGVVTAWDATTGAVLREQRPRRDDMMREVQHHTLHASGAFHSFQSSADRGSFFQIRERESGKMELRPAWADYRRAVVSPDGRILMVCGPEWIEVRSVETGRIAYTLSSNSQWRSY